MKFLQKYIGRSYEEMDCWQLVRAIYKDLGKPLPEIALCPTLISYAKAIKSEQTSRRWAELSKPEFPCVVAMSNDGRVYHHVGVFTGRGIIHSANHHGVIHQSVRKALMNGALKARYYRWEG